ncbi:MAG: glycolate oxidase subunit GlcF [Thiohalomonadales bacterium]
MQTKLSTSLLQTAQGQEADEILRRCVHCGFCTAACPTYQIFNDELDGPRGRIYLIKELLEGAKVSTLTQTHLDRCLLCRACETACPSGVEYGRLLEIGRHEINKKVRRSLGDRLRRWLVVKLLPRQKIIKKLLPIARIFRFLLPSTVRNQIDMPQISSEKKRVWPRNRHDRKILLLQGCVQSGVVPDIDISFARVMDSIGISVVTETQIECCGAIEFHLDYRQAALKRIKANIDICWPHVESGIEAIVMTASGCTLMLQDYAQLLSADKVYLDKARQISMQVLDIVQILEKEDLSNMQIHKKKKRIAYHAPCTQQHGLKLPNNVKSLLLEVGYQLMQVEQTQICCGSAGSYSIFNPAIADNLRVNKLHHLQRHNPDFIATANIGCLLHLTAKAEVPVLHWIQLLDDPAC